MTINDTLKPIALTMLIVIGLCAKYSQAHASATETLTVAGGCFWCVESDFEGVNGVVEVVSGYTGGGVANPTYKQVTQGETGHYEAVQITFNPSIVSRETLLHAFLRSVDPTDAGGQFCDRGESYRTAIFVSDQREKAAAEAALAKAQTDLGQRVVTPVLPVQTFYQAEDYHQDYYKGSSLVLTRFGPRQQATAYKLYRRACGRDERVRQLWGAAAPFAKH